MNKPKIVTLCGSTKFREEFFAANFRETMAGKIVLSVGFFHHSNEYSPTEQEKDMLDELHFRKIEISDEVLILNVDDYIGYSTNRERDYARKLGKTVRYLEPPEES